MPVTTLVLATANLDFTRKRKAHRADLRSILMVADAVAAQELRHVLRKAFGWVAKVVHPRRPGGQEGSEAIIVKRPKMGGPKVLDRGRPLASPERHGHAIGLRRMPWVMLDVAGIGFVFVVCVHWVPRRMQGGKLEAAYTKTLHGLLDWAVKSGIKWAVLGDLNRPASEDPAALLSKYDARLLGDRIDLIALSPDLAPHLAGWFEDLNPKRRDKHPVVYARLATKE